MLGCRKSRKSHFFFLKGDWLIVDDITYTVDIIDKHPTELNPDEPTIRENDEAFVFHGAVSSFSGSYSWTCNENGVALNNFKQCVN